MPRQSKANASERSLTLLRAIEEHLAPLGKVTVSGQKYTPKQLAAVYKAHLDALRAVIAARAHLGHVIEEERAAEAKATKLAAGLRDAVASKFGQDSTVFAEFGWTEHKRPGPKTVESKATMVRKRRARRDAKGGRG